MTWMQRLTIAILTVGVVILPSHFSGWMSYPWATLTGEPSGFNSVAIAQTPVSVQRLNPAQIAALVYAELPDLPRENGYFSDRTNAVAESNTLVSRLIQYHTTVKRRSPAYRLDWKLTLADYLGANEYISAPSYPSADTLDVNPLTLDQRAIAQLTRSQRDQLVQVLVELYRPELATLDASPPPATSPPLPSQPPPLSSPQPGAADQLRL